MGLRRRGVREEASNVGMDSDDQEDGEDRGRKKEPVTGEAEEEDKELKSASDEKGTRGIHIIEDIIT